MDKLELATDPENSAVYNNLGILYGDTGRTKESIEYKKKAWSLRKSLLYFNNLLSIYKNVNDKKKLYDEAYQHLKKNNDFIIEYRKFLRDNDYLSDLFTYYFNQFNEERTTINYLNLLEISIVTRNEKVIGDLINDTEISGSLSIGERIIKLFLLMVDSIIKGENYNKSDLDICCMIKVNQL